ncbi:PLP-dependent cysteine synthase family protein [Mucilaginibacter sp. CAU 1740]|uniref:PLP-dependent cysteine synthase family protein n=1 Tax=Mucilaginibacter sp. CAU 1740 TaxID=3140365 RepID=UPI00325BB260
MTTSRIANLWRMVGQTPMYAIVYRYDKGPEQQVLVKCEHLNLTGSIKDRMALYILEKAGKLGKLKPNDMIVEATSGNSGIAFAAIGRALGHQVRILMPDWMSMERRALIESYGAEVQLVSKAQGGFLGSIRIAEDMGRQPGVFLPRQFENEFNVEAHHETTGREIGHQLLLQRLKPDAFVAGVGTGGTVMGVGKYLRMLYPAVKIHPLEPLESPTMSTGYKVGSHRIQGISDEFIPEIIKLDQLNKIIQVSDGDAILMAQRMSRELSLGVGISSGANLLGAIRLQQQYGQGSTVVTVFPDSNKKYVSTDLFRKEPVKGHYLSPRVELLDCRFLEK